MTSNNNGVCRIVIIGNERGLHARASAKLANVAGEFDANVTVSKDGTSVCGTSIMGLMMLTAATGDEISIKCEGAEQVQALEAIEALIKDKFGEKG